MLRVVRYFCVSLSGKLLCFPCTNDHGLEKSIIQSTYAIESRLLHKYHHRGDGYGIIRSPMCIGRACGFPTIFDKVHCNIIRRQMWIPNLPEQPANTIVFPEAIRLNLLPRQVFLFIVTNSDYTPATGPSTVKGFGLYISCIEEINP